MTDLEITRLCAEAMGGKVKHDLPLLADNVEGWIRLNGVNYDPLTNDEQAMALVKRHRLDISDIKEEYWLVAKYSETAIGNPPVANTDWSRDSDLNRAICECVAKMQAKKAT